MKQIKKLIGNLKQKGKLQKYILLALIVLGAIFVLKVLILDKGVFNASGKTYVNEEYGFRFNYPEGWHEVPNGDGDSKESLTLINKEEYLSDFNKYSFTSNDYSSISVTVIKYDKNYYIGGKDVVYNQSSDLLGYVVLRTGAPASEIKKYSLDGENGYLRTYVNPSTKLQQNRYLPKPKKE